MLEISEFKVLDRNSDYYGTSVSQLMENAGKGVADYVLEHRGRREKAVVVCGPGHNGGDGLVTAFHLRDSMKVMLLMAREPDERSGELVKLKYSAVSDLVVSEKLIEGIRCEDVVVVDALLGTGANRPPEGRYLELIELMQSMRDRGALLISVDVPSGFPSKVHLNPEVTLTLHDSKNGMQQEDCGRIVVVDIGIPYRASRYTGPGEMLLYPVPGKHTHKGNNGIVTVVGGSAFAGAPTFASLAAYRTGADLVYTIVPKGSYAAVSGFSPNLMVFSTKSDLFSEEDMEGVMRWIQRSSALVIGPGMDESEGSLNFISGVIRRATCPLVVDAAAISAVGSDRSLLQGKSAVVTPHSREFEKLTGEQTEQGIEERAEQIRSWAVDISSTILLKGATDIISDGNRIKLNDTGNPGMTVGGTGDVLTGIVAALLSKGSSTFDAARVGAYINGSSGDICFDSKSYGLLATDVIESIPTVLVKQLEGKP